MNNLEILDLPEERINELRELFSGIKESTGKLETVTDWLDDSVQTIRK